MISGTPVNFSGVPATVSRTFRGVMALMLVESTRGVGSGGDMLEVVNGVRCVLWVLGDHALHAVPYVALYSGGRGDRAPFARGAKVMRNVLELRAPRAVSCAPCAGGREGCAACAVGAVMGCVLLIHGRCVMYAGGFAPWATLYAGGCGG